MRNKVLTPEFVDDHTGAELHRFGWLPDSLIGDLPKEWNVLVGEQENKNANCGIKNKCANGKRPQSHFPHSTSSPALCREDNLRGKF
jgi:hypothetical protein